MSTRAAAAAIAVLLLAGCTPTTTDTELVTTTATALHPTLPADPGVTVISDVDYGNGELLDVCLPPDAAAGASPRPTIVAIHGGSWTRGDKNDLDFGPVCRWLASEGYVVASVNYRLAPEWSFPSPLEDVQQAVRWLREPAQIAAYGIDPDRIGAFGASAGGNLAELLALTGSGDWISGSRVAAVVTMSGISDLREAIDAGPLYNGDFAQAQLDYLGCVAFDECATAAAASPVLLVDATDPPFLVTHSVGEFIPIAQSDALAAALEGVGVPTTYLRVKGALHGVSILDAAMCERVIEFFRATLGDPSEE